MEFFVDDLEVVDFSVVALISSHYRHDERSRYLKVPEARTYHE